VSTAVDDRSRNPPARPLTAIYADGASFEDQLALARRMVPLIYDDAST